MQCQSARKLWRKLPSEMGSSNASTTKRKRELLDHTNKRKMSLRKYIDLQLPNECRLEFPQVPKCVFLATLCLKPVPQLFEHPVVIEEVATAPEPVANNNTEMNNENLTGHEECANDKATDLTKKNARRRLHDHKSRKKAPKQIPQVQIEEIKEETKESTPEVVAIATEPVSSDPPTPEKTYRTLLPPKLSPPSLPDTPESNLVVENELRLLNSKFHEGNGGKDPEGLKPLEARVDFKREPTPELLLSDPDDDTIDQLMYNIMDIKVEKNSINKDFYGMSPSDEDDEEDFEYSGDNPELENDSKSKKKYSKPTPKCKICSQVFSSYAQLKSHRLEHNGEKPYPCLKCGQGHSTVDLLLAHLRTHQGKRPYVCKKCHKSFKTMKGFNNHQPIHVLRKVVPKKKSYMCEVCGKEFHKLCDLDRHTRVHTGEKPSVCNICNRRFQQAHNLNKHLLIHTQEKPYQCEICSKRFGRNDVLNRHLLTHSLKKPNTCEVCRKSFIRASQLMAHMEKHHGK